MNVIFTAWAEECLKEIFKYYSENANAETASEIINKILDKAESLNKYPNRGRIEDDLQELGMGHRYLVEYHYKIIYRTEGNKAIVTDIFSNRQDPEKKRERNR